MRVIIRNVSSKISSKKERIALNKMLNYLNGYKRECVLAPLFKMLEASFDLFVPLVMADIVNVGIAAHDFHYILMRCGILLLLAIIGGINWGIYGIWGFNAVGWLLGGSMSWLSRTVFIVVGAAALCLIPGLFAPDPKAAE